MDILSKAVSGVSQKPAGENFAQDLIRQAVKTANPTPSPEPEKSERPAHMESLIKRQRELSGDPGVSLSADFVEEPDVDTPEDVPGSPVPPNAAPAQTPASPLASAVSALMPHRKALSSADTLSGGFVEDKEPVSIPLFSDDGMIWTGPEWMTLRLATYDTKRGVITLQSKEYRIEITGKRLVKVILSIQAKRLSRCSPSPPVQEKDLKVPYISSVEIIENEDEE